MAEDDTQDKSEEPTGRKLQKAREEGQVPRSKELSTMSVLIAGAVGLLLFGGGLASALARVIRDNFVIDRGDIYDTKQMGLHLLESGVEIAWALAPFMLLIMIAGVVGNVAVGGFLFSAKGLQPKFNKLNPVEGIKRMFSLNSLVELGKAIAKVIFVMGVAIFILSFESERLLNLSREPLPDAIAHAAEIAAWSFLYLSCTMILITAIDIPFQMYSHTKKLKMTKQEVKDEFKDTEGKPEIKQKIRQLQYQMAYRRMMQDVPEADVIITNPDHYAVALKYDANTMAAPLLLAKGVDEVAEKIKEIARAHKIEILSAPPLARSVYYNTEVGGEIPAGLYMAMAQVLAYIFQLKRYRRGFSQKPSQPKYPIPDELKHD
jgi:flagellar biosynthetic protein FlhB